MTASSRRLPSISRAGDGNDNDVVVCRDLLHDRVVVNRTLHDIRVGSGLRAASDDGYLVAA